MTSAGRGRAAPRGLTLLEMLVVLALTSALVALLAQAGDQLRRVESLLGSEALQARVDRLHLDWLTAAVEGVVPVAGPQARPFAGDARGFAARSTQVPAFPLPRPGRMQVAIVDDAAGGGAMLVLQPLADDAEPPAERDRIVILRWAAATASMAYVDADGAAHAQWPPFHASAPGQQNPSAWRLELGGARPQTLQVNIRAIDAAPMTRRMMEAL